MTSSKPSLIVFSDDWGRHPSSCQHLVSHLLDEFDVTWINTIGTRTPRLDAATMRRGFEKIRQWGAKRESVQQWQTAAPRVLNPMMWPSFGSGWSRALNRRTLSRFLERNIEQLGSSTVLTTIPVVADLAGRIPAARWVYYCVDDFAEWPGLDGRTLRTMENALIDRVDEIVAAGPNLAEGIERRGREPVVLTHGVDIEHWQLDEFAAHPKLADLERPVALFWGLIDRRLDVDWLQHLAAGMQSGTIVLIGPEQDADEALNAIPRLVHVGPLPYDELPQAAAAADVLIMPYADLPVTRAMQPLKLKEYLATGKPVVVRRLPATADWDECLFEADNAAEFTADVQACCREGIPADQQSSRCRLADESWAAKAESLKHILWPTNELAGAKR